MKLFVQKTSVCIMASLIVFFVCTLLFAAYPASADDVDVVYQIPISGETHIPVCASKTDPTGKHLLECGGIATYIDTIYKWGVAFASVLAVLAFTYAGVLWLIAGGDSGKVTESKKIMGTAIAGLLFALGSYTMLWVINPDLVQFSPITVPGIEPIDASFIASAPDEGERGKPTNFTTAAVTDPCDLATSPNNTFTFFAAPAYAYTCPVTMVLALQHFGLPPATGYAYPNNPKCKRSDCAINDRAQADMLWDAKNSNVKEGIVKAAQALYTKYPEKGSQYQYEGLIGMWAIHEMQLNPYGSACGGENSFPLNADCDWGDGEHYQVGLGVHTEQIQYLEEAFTAVIGGTNMDLVKSVAQSVIDTMAGKHGHAHFCTKDYDASLKYCKDRKKFISTSDFNDVSSLKELIAKAKKGNIKSRRQIVTLMRYPAIGAYLIGRHLTTDTHVPLNKLGEKMTHWRGDGYPPQEMANIFADWYQLKKL